MAARPRRQAGTNDTRTPAQNRRIYGLRSQIARAAGLPADDIDPMLRDACRRIAGHDHTSRLTQPQADALIGVLERELAKYGASGDRPEPKPHEPYGPRGGKRAEEPITPFQTMVIHGMFRLCTAVDGSFPGLRERRAFVQRQVKKDWPTTQAEADKVITPLWDIAKRAIDPDDVKRRVLALRGASLDEWKTGFVADVAEQLEAARTPMKVLTPGMYVKILECEQAAGVAR